MIDVSPFARGLVNPDDYYKVLTAWLLPVPDGIDIRWYQSATDAERGIVAIAGSAGGRCTRRSRRFSFQLGAR